MEQINQQSTGSTSQSDCICDVGYYDDGNGNCIGCEPGKFNNTKGVTSCTNCPIGQYNTAVAATSCTACNTGTTTDGSGNLIQMNVRFVLLDITVTVQHTVCPKGSYKDTTGQTSCTSCGTTKQQQVQVQLHNQIVFVMLDIKWILIKL